MSIASRMVAALIDSGSVGLVLTNGDRTVSSVVTPGSWLQGDGTAAGSVTFGPFNVRTVADGVGVVVDGTVESVIPLAGRVELPPGMTFDYEATLLAVDR